MRKTVITILLFVCGACIGAFISVRMNALMISSWNIRLPIWGLLVIPCLLGFLSAVFNKRLLGYFKNETNFKVPSACIISFASLAFCIEFRSRVVEEALAASGASLGLWIMTVLIGASLLLALFILYIWSAVKSSCPRIRQWVKSLDKRDFIFLAAVIVILNLLAWFYTSRSSKIYFWDTAGYWQITQMLADTARQGFGHLLVTVYHSVFNLDYNYLIALPGTPLMLIFGPTRWVYICGIVNFGLFPVITLVYFYIRSICKRKILATLCLFCTFPMLFYTAIVGYIDVLGVFFILASILIWKSDKNKNDLWRYIVIGVLLAIAALLRRWYCFFVLSFIITLIADSFIYKKSVIPVIGTLAAFGFSLLFMFQPFVSNVLLKNYSQLYSAYKMGLAFDFEMFFNYFGLFTIVVAFLTGIYFCFRREKRQMLLFLLLQTIICFIVFFCVQSHNQQHLLLYVPSLMMIMTMLICPLADALTKRKTAGILLAINTLLPSLVTFYPALHPEQIDKVVSVSLLPKFTFKPPVWKDAPVIVKIIRYLDEEAGSKGKTVGVLASSFALNNDILANAESSLNLERISDVSRSYLVQLPGVDSRDAFPGSLFECDYFLVADPIQLHLGEEKQQTVYLPAQQVLSHQGIGAAFEEIGETFYMNGGEIKIRLYEKTRDLTQAEKDELLKEFNAHKQH